MASTFGLASAAGSSAKTRSIETTKANATDGTSAVDAGTVEADTADGTSAIDTRVAKRANATNNCGASTNKTAIGIAICREGSAIDTATDDLGTSVNWDRLSNRDRDGVRLGNAVGNVDSACDSNRDSHILVHGNTSDDGNLVRLIEVDRYLDGHIVRDLDWDREGTSNFNKLLNGDGHRTRDSHLHRHGNATWDLEDLLDRDTYRIWHFPWDINLAGDTTFDGVWNLNGNAHGVRDSVLDRNRNLIRLLDEHLIWHFNRVTTGNSHLNRNTDWNTDFIRDLHGYLDLHWSTNFDSNWDRHLDGLRNFDSNWDRYLNLDRGAYLNSNRDWHLNRSTNLHGHRHRHLNLVGLGHLDGHRDGNLHRGAHLDRDGYGNLNGGAHLDRDGHGNLNGNLVRNLHGNFALHRNRNLHRHLHRHLIRLRNRNRNTDGSGNHLLPWHGNGDGRTRHNSGGTLDGTARNTVGRGNNLRGRNNTSLVDATNTTDSTDAEAIAIDTANAGADDSAPSIERAAVNSVHGKTAVGI